MALAPVDETGEDLENLDFTTCKERIAQLQADRERRLEATERLQEKLKALNNELAARRLEADQRKMELKEEQNRNKQHAAEQRERGEDTTLETRKEEDQSKVRNFIEEMIQEKASGPQKKEKQKSKFGFRVFDETELMVEKPMERKEGKEVPVDTVLVTHQKPNSDDVRYHLSYRVAKDTPSKKLREDACNYWNLSEVEYILLTVENSKVHDDVPLQHCFKPNERCQLILAPKDPRRQILMDKEIEATRPKMGKASKREKKVNPVTAEANQGSGGQKPGGSIVDWMQLKPGIWDFMVQRDRNVTDHLTRIKLRSIWVYFLFFVTCMVLYHYVKPPGAAYHMRQGALLAMTHPHVDVETGESVPKFEDIKTQEEVWKWLTYTVSHQLLKADSDLRLHNYLVGWLRIRMQQVSAAAPANCKPEEMAPADMYCVNVAYENDKPTEHGHEDLEFVRLYWDGYNATTTSTTTTVTTTYQGQFGRRLFDVMFPKSSREAREVIEEPYLNILDADEDSDREGAQARRLTYSMASWTENYPYTSDLPTVKGTDGRSSRVSPWKFHEAKKNIAEHAVAAITGLWQSYPADGYNLDYNMQYANLTALESGYRADMFALRERGWFTNRTRSIIVSFALYSSNYDLWTQNDFVLEMPVSAIVIPQHRVDVFSPSMEDTSHSAFIFWADSFRLLLALFILFAQTCYEISVAKAREEQWLSGYLLTPLGIADLGIGCLTIYIYLLREIILGFVEKPDTYLEGLITNEEGFHSTSATAWLYRQQLQWEAPLFALVVFRLFSFLRINRQIYIIWKTLVDAAKLYIPFCLVLCPVGFGLIIWAHGLWHSTHRQYTSIPSSAMSLIMMIHGDVNLEEMFLGERPDTLVFGVLIYVVTWLLIVNAWIAVLVHVYQKTRVRAGYHPADYRWREKHYVVWTLWTPLARFYFNWLRKTAEKPVAFQKVEEDDDDK